MKFKSYDRYFMCMSDKVSAFLVYVEYKELLLKCYEKRAISHYFLSPGYVTPIWISLKQQFYGRKLI